MRVLALRLAVIATAVFLVAEIPEVKAQQRDEQTLSIQIADRDGHHIGGLHANDFRILEDDFIVEKINTFEEKGESYNVTYFPVENPNIGFRKITVIVDVPDLTVRAKSGYVPSK